MQHKHALRTYTQANITPVSYPVFTASSGNNLT